MRLHMYIFCILMVLGSSATDLSGQLRYLQANTHLGGIIKHREGITFDTKTPAWGVDLGMYWQTQGEKPWQEFHHFPRFHLTARFHDLGDKDIVGEAIGFSAGVEINLSRKKESAFHFVYSLGYAYLTRPFDRITNPSNNAIGSHVNNSVTLKLDYERRLGEKMMLHIGGQLVHYSNGARKLPNLGLNIPGLYVALSPYRGTYDPEFYNIQRRTKKTKKKWAAGIYAHYAQIEIRAPGGPDYPIYAFGVDAYYQLNANHRHSIGYQYDYHESISVFGLHTGDFNTDAEARVGASRHAVNFGHEFLVGPWGIHLKVGIYTNRRTGWLIPRPYNFQLSPRYYFNRNDKSCAQFYTGLQLKSHLFVAEYIAFGLGMTFH